MKKLLLPSSAKVRDAGEVAFGILIFGILIFVFSLIVSIFPAAFFPKDYWRTIMAIFIGIFWVAGMTPLLIHYKKAAREWGEERRGDSMLKLVELLSAIAKLITDQVLPDQPNDDMRDGLKFYLSVFVILLASSHMLTYLLLRYKPKAKEIMLWLGIATVFIVEHFR